MLQGFIGAKGREYLEGQVTALDIVRLERPQQGRIQAGDASSGGEFLQYPQSSMAHLNLRMVEGTIHTALYRGLRYLGHNGEGGGLRGNIRSIEHRLPILLGTGIVR